MGFLFCFFYSYFFFYFILFYFSLFFFSFFYLNNFSYNSVLVALNNKPGALPRFFFLRKQWV
ncbi:MAG TPA: hypothetical protein ENL16_02845 [Candidatus Woesearchaeota archaeon]|nr:hypothetical protein [Candidatus Woesearchaeota archaeon]